MRTTVMSDMLHGQLVDRLTTERKRASNSIRLIERNRSRDWAGIPTQNRRDQEARLPALVRTQDELTDLIDALNGAATQ